MEGKSKTIYVALICILMFIAGGLVGYYCFNCTVKNTNTDCGSTVQENETEKEQEIETISYVGAYAYLRNTSEEGDKYYDRIYLRSDNTFYLSYKNEYANQPKVGTYIVNNDGTITLKETVHYGSDACFYTNNLQTYTVKIVDSKTLSMSIEGETINLVKGILEEESKESLAYYVANPVNGQTAEGWGDSWTDCTNLQKK